MILFGCYAPGSKANTWNCGEMNTNLDKDEITASVCDRTPRILYAWAHSAPNFVLPKDVGFKIGGKSTGINYLVLQIHYAKKTEETDYSGIRITTTKKHLSKQAATMVLFTQGEIGPHSKENFETACPMEDDIPIHPFAFRVHTHAHGRLVRGWVVKKDENWTLLGERDPQLPQLFDLTESSDIINKGDILAARCEMINEEDRLVSVGLSSRDEMCNFYLMFWIEGDNLPNKNTCYSEGPPNYYFNSSTKLLKNGHYTEGYDGGMVLLKISHQNYVSLMGFGRIACLHGEVEINGFSISPKNSDMNKTYEFGCLKSTTMPISIINRTSQDNFWSHDQNVHLNEELDKIFDFTQFMSNHICGDSIILLTDQKTKQVEFVKGFYPLAFSNFSRCLHGSQLFADLFLLDTKLIKKVPELYNHSQLNALKQIMKVSNCNSFNRPTNCQRILALGADNSGKSTFNRYIANRLLSGGNKNVYWLDLDIGNPEFTVPCVMSLSKVEEPILTPPAFHVKLKPLRTYFYGKSNMDSSYERYTTIMDQLIQLYVTDFASLSHNSILIINAMGFPQYKYKDMYINMLTILKPSFLVTCKEPSTNYAFTKPTSFTTSADIFLERTVITSPLTDLTQPPKHLSINSGKDAKNMRICGYFSYIMDIFKGQIFNFGKASCWPYYKIDMKSYEIHVDENLPMLEEASVSLALNVTLVAFCTYIQSQNKLDNSGFIQNDFRNSHYPKFLTYNYRGFEQKVSFRRTNLIVIGYGVITNIDRDNYQFHVTTPLTQKQLKEDVKIIARGIDFNMPPEFIKNQGVPEDDNYKILETCDFQWYVWNTNFTRRPNDTRGSDIEKKKLH
uniref:Peptidylglycine monooxygenase n=1 Tax=Rhabditophanes sp. KR3021 TaxID=114890 RepID=A0AC35UDU3_9BILA